MKEAITVRLDKDIGPRPRDCSATRAYIQSRVLRVFLDTNVLVAAFATRGLCADVLRTVLAEHALLLSGTVIEEFTRTLIAHKPSARPA